MRHDPESILGWEYNHEPWTRCFSVILGLVFDGEGKKNIEKPLASCIQWRHGRTLKYSVRRAASPTRRDTAKRRTSTWENQWMGQRKFKTKLVLLIKYRGSCIFFLHPILKYIHMTYDIWHLYEPSIISISGGKCRAKKCSIISELDSPKSMPIHFETERDAERSFKYSAEPAWLQHLCRKKCSANNDIIQNSFCLSFFLSFSLFLSLSLSLSLSLFLFLFPRRVVRCLIKQHLKIKLHMPKS